MPFRKFLPTFVPRRASVKDDNNYHHLPAGTLEWPTRELAGRCDTNIINQVQLLRLETTLEAHILRHLPAFMGILLDKSQEVRSRLVRWWQAIEPLDKEHRSLKARRHPEQDMPFHLTWFNRNNGKPWDLTSSSQNLEAWQCSARKVDREHGVDDTKHDLDLSFGEYWTLFCDTYHHNAFLILPILSFDYRTRMSLTDRFLPCADATPGSHDSHLLWLGLDVVKQICESTVKNDTMKPCTFCSIFAKEYDNALKYTKAGGAHWVNDYQGAEAQERARRAKIDAVLDNWFITRTIRSYDRPENRKRVLAIWIDFRKFLKSDLCEHTMTGERYEQLGSEVWKMCENARRWGEVRPRARALWRKYEGREDSDVEDDL